MTKQEAIEQMKLGHKLTHRHFTDEEWVKSNQTGTIFILEDGVECSPQEFWKWRTDESWNADWDLFISQLKEGNNE